MLYISYILKSEKHIYYLYCSCNPCEYAFELHSGQCSKVESLLFDHTLPIHCLSWCGCDINPMNVSVFISTEDLG